MEKFIIIKDEIEAIQVRTENYAKILEAFPEYRISGSNLYDPSGNTVRQNYWLVNTAEGIMTFSDTIFNRIYKKKPLDKYTVSEACAQSRAPRIRKEWFEDGCYIEWNGYTWIMVTPEQTQIYMLSPQELSEKEWILIR